MKGILEILLFITLIKGCPLKKSTTTSSIKKCYKTYTKTSSTITDTMTTETMTTDTMTTDTMTTDTMTTDTMTTDTMTTDTMTTDTMTTETITTTSTTSISPTNGVDNIPITRGKNATLTYFTDTVTQCYGGDIPVGNGVAVNPLLLGFTLDDWNTRFSNADPNNIPWCGRMLNVTVNGNTFSSRIIDTCNPGDEGAFIDPNTGQIIGGKCDYSNVIDLYGEPGLQFLQSTVGDDFYQGELEWVIY